MRIRTSCNWYVKHTKTQRYLHKIEKNITDYSNMIGQHIGKNVLGQMGFEILNDHLKNNQYFCLHTTTMLK